VSSYTSQNSSSSRASTTARTVRLWPKGARDERNIAIKQERRVYEQKSAYPGRGKKQNNERSSVCSVLFRLSLDGKARPGLTTRLHPLRRTRTNHKLCQKHFDKQFEQLKFNNVCRYLVGLRTIPPSTWFGDSLRFTLVSLRVNGPKDGMQKLMGMGEDLG
jgi:hypothetical protein